MGELVKRKDVRSPEYWDGHRLNDACLPTQPVRLGRREIQEGFAARVLTELLTSPNGSHVERTFGSGEVFNPGWFPTGTVVKLDLEDVTLTRPDNDYEQKKRWGVVVREQTEQGPRNTIVFYAGDPVARGRAAPHMFLPLNRWPVHIGLVSHGKYDGGSQIVDRIQRLEIHEEGRVRREFRLPLLRRPTPQGISL